MIGRLLVGAGRLLPWTDAVEAVAVVVAAALGAEATAAQDPHRFESDLDLLRDAAEEADHLVIVAPEADRYPAA
jgi:hypothetical protein